MLKLFVDPSKVLEHHIIVDNRDDVKHIRKVLRLKEGDRIEISDNTSWEYYSCEIFRIEDDHIEAAIIEKCKCKSEPGIEITLFQGIPKSDKMETIIQKCTELGVREIVPVWNARTVVTDKGNFAKKIERWQKVAVEASKQCKRSIIPTVSGDIRFSEMVARLGDYDLVVFPYENETDYSIKDLLSALTEKPHRIALIIGPEGGFDDEEVSAISRIGASPVTLGKTVLRTETAGPAATAMIFYALEL